MDLVPTVLKIRSLFRVRCLFGVYSEEKFDLLIFIFKRIGVCKLQTNLAIANQISQKF